MSVLKNLRSLSSMEFYKNAIELRKAITMWMVRDFGTRRNARSVASVIKDIDDADNIINHGEVLQRNMPSHTLLRRWMHCSHLCSVKENNMEENIKREELEAELRVLRSELQANTSNIGDWKIIKALEYQLTGEETPYDMKKLNAERQKVRDRINEIEAEILAIDEVR